MRFVIFYHSLVSDWNHGNAHFLRGVVRELLARGHEVSVYEPANNWSLTNLRAEHGEKPLADLHERMPYLASTFYDHDTLDLDAALAGADVVLVHEWNEHALVNRIGEHRRTDGSYRLLFHDTHHRSVTDPRSMAAYDLSNYDGVLAFGRVIRDVYLRKGWTRQAWTWHEAADAELFRPLPAADKEGDILWIGNWGDDERTQELHEMLIGPVRALKLKARVHGVRYPIEGRKALAAAGIEYRGWIPNYRVPEVFARFRTTIHIPRRPYREQLPGIPTIRVFEALACGIPLVSVEWNDLEGLFQPGKDFLVARDGAAMFEHLRSILSDPDGLGAELARHGRNTILARHTCRHRADELLAICRALGVDDPSKLRLQVSSVCGPPHRRKVPFSEGSESIPWLASPPRGTLPTT